MDQISSSASLTGFNLNYDALNRTLKRLQRFHIPLRRVIMRKVSLARGEYGTVLLGRLKPAGSTSELDDIAIKILRATNIGLEPERLAFRLAREALVWSSCKHENILEFTGYYLGDDLVTAYLLSPYMRYGDAKVYLATKQPTNDLRFKLVRDTMDGLDYLHNRDPPVVHGGLKAKNVLITDSGRAVLCDFVLSTTKQTEHTELTTGDALSGAIRWRAPEVLDGMERTVKSDIWAWGCLALEMMTDNLPYFETRADTKVLLLISQGFTPEPNPPPRDWPNGLLELVGDCWSFQPEDRPDACTCVASLHSVPKVKEYLHEEVLQSLKTCFILGSRLRDDPNHTLPETRCCTSRTAVLLPPDDSITESLKNVVVKGLRLHDLPSFSSRFDSCMTLAGDIASWASFEHENILEFIGFSVSADLGTVSLITPYMAKGNVTDYIRREEVNHEGILDLVRDTLNGLLYLHIMDPPVVHGNLTPFNVLVNENGKALLADYALRASGEVNLTGKTTGAFTRWSSPEVISGEPVTVQSDVWSWACIVIQMITGDHPYPDIEKDDELASILASDQPDRRTPKPLSTPAAVSDALLGLLQLCWDFDPWSRADARKCMDTLDSMPEAQSGPYQSDRGAASLFTTNTPPCNPHLSADKLKGLPSTTKSTHAPQFALEGTITIDTAGPVNTSGAFCDLFTGTHPIAGKVALKRPRGASYTDALKRQIETEAGVWIKLNHPRILKFLGLYTFDEVIYLVSPFAEFGSLPSYLASFPSADRGRLVIEIAEGLAYLHQFEPGIVHGDVKGNNVLIASDHHARLCDFGLARHVDVGTMTGLKGAGSLPWQSPEIMRDGVSKSLQSDVYAFGITVYEILSGKVPYSDRLTSGAIIAGVLLSGLRPPLEPSAAPDGTSYLRFWSEATRCWSDDPAERPSMATVLQSLSNPTDEPKL